MYWATAGGTVGRKGTARQCGAARSPRWIAMYRTRKHPAPSLYGASQTCRADAEAWTGAALPPVRPVVAALSSSWSLPRDATAAGQARRLTRHFLLHRGLAEHAETAELLVSELVTNALVHGHGPITLRLRRRRGTLRCEVTDHCAEVPGNRPQSPDSETGRGIHLLEMLARRWGVRCLDRGKAVWFELVTATTCGDAAEPG